MSDLNIQIAKYLSNGKGSYSNSEIEEALGVLKSEIDKSPNKKNSVFSFQSEYKNLNLDDFRAGFYNVLGDKDSSLDTELSI
ncbi:hypothetical protein IJ670_05035, partial [bacterium]|nr:hypothetical protein [bacterium]